MPPKNKFTREEIVRAALEITRESGFSAVTARAVAARLGASPKVIFGLFRNMEELLSEVMAAAHQVYLGYVSGERWQGEYPAFKAMGMGYICFAREEQELFKLLFMRDRTGEQTGDNPQELEPVLRVIQKNTGLSREQAYMFHLESWIFSHGLAAMLATNYLPWEEETISAMLTDVYQGLRRRYAEKNKEEGT